MDIEADAPGKIYHLLLFIYLAWGRHTLNVPLLVFSLIDLHLQQIRQYMGEPEL